METILKIKNGQMMATCEINGVMFIQLAEFESVFARAAIAEEENAFLKELNDKNKHVYNDKICNLEADLRDLRKEKDNLEYALLKDFYRVLMTVLKLMGGE